jgi:outer membrane protein TolC
MWVGGCSRDHYRESADTEVQQAIAEKVSLVPNMDPNFSLSEEVSLDLSGYPVSDQAVAFFGPDPNIEMGSRILSLEDALEIAVKHNRTYQNEKESLYLEALSLTLSRHQYTPIFSGGVGVGFQETRSGVDSITTDRNVNVDGALGGEKLLRAGGKIAAGFTTDFFRYLLGSRNLPASSALAATLTQPLLRGAGYKAAMENLTQAERNLLYSLRDFTRFRKEFTVNIVGEYYRVLQDRDRVRNAWQAYQSFRDNVNRENARYEEGLTRKADLAELQESELTNEQSWVNALRSYRENLDRFKISLGLTTNERIVLDDRELDKLGIDETHLAMTLDEAIKVALTSRLDLETVKDQLADSERRIEVAANGLLPDLDFVLAGQMTSHDGVTRPDIDFQRYTWSAGLEMDLPLDRKQERNNFRAALINYERSRRNHENYVDQIRLDIQNGWRNLEQARRDYEISRVRVELSKSRVREQELYSEIGEGDAFEMVRAQDALTGSQNELTAALINHTLTRLAFWRDIGLLYITTNGQWTEEAYAQDQRDTQEIN